MTALRSLSAFSFDTQVTHHMLASAVATQLTAGPQYPVRQGDRLRLQHSNGYCQDASRKIQFFGSMVVGLAFYDSTGTLIDAIAMGSGTPPATADTVVVPVDGALVMAEDQHFLEVSAAGFLGATVPSFVSAYTAVNCKNSDGAAAHDLVLGVIGVLEIETEI